MTIRRRKCSRNGKQEKADHKNWAPAAVGHDNPGPRRTDECETFGAETNVEAVFRVKPSLLKGVDGVVGE